MENTNNVNNVNKKVKIIISIILVLLVLGLIFFLGFFRNDIFNSDSKIGIGKDNLIAKVGDRITMNYTGKLVDNTIFYSTIDERYGNMQPMTFLLGVGNVVAGWDEGIVGMKVGEKKTLVVPPQKAYGSARMGPIPPNSTLIYDVEILKIEKIEK